MLETLLKLDNDLFLFLNGINSPFFDVIMLYVSWKFTWIPLYGYLMYLLIKEHKWETVYFTLSIVLLITLSDQCSNLFKFYFERLRPCHEPDLESIIHYFSCGGRFGFFSAHSSNTFALATFVALVFGEKKYLYLRIIFFSYAGLNAYSRIYLGVHYPGDVIFGALIGVGLGFFVFNILALCLRFFRVSV